MCFNVASLTLLPDTCSAVMVELDAIALEMVRQPSSPSEFHRKSSVFKLRLVVNALASAVPASAVKRLFRKSSDVNVLLGDAKVDANARNPSGNSPNEFHSNDIERRERLVVNACAKATAPGFRNW